MVQAKRGRVSRQVRAKLAKPSTWASVAATATALAGIVAPFHGVAGAVLAGVGVVAGAFGTVKPVATVAGGPGA
ncbi:MAG: hypothetical protein KF740_19395 [Ramlibacter sp.]|nr:hypothetical protein [Ramlibacter sp.]